MIGGEKGGSGKSTIATNLTVWLSKEGRDVVLVDADKQGTASNWLARREEYYPDLPQIHKSVQHGNIFKAVQDLSTRYEDVVIDAGGRDSEELRSGMVACQSIYVPLRPSQADIETAAHVAELIKLARGFAPDLDARAVITMAPTNPFINERKEAMELLSELPEFKLSRSIIRDRKVYRDAMAEGLGVVEMDNSKAKAELQILAQEIFTNG